VLSARFGKAPLLPVVRPPGLHLSPFLRNALAIEFVVYHREVYVPLALAV
jgi:hypothetical protein